jgi:hypothetical protein
MLKARKRWISLLLIMAMLFVSCMPAVPPAEAAISGYEAFQVPRVDTDSVDRLGTVLCTVRAGALKPGDTVSLRLPTDFQFLKGNQKDDVMFDEDWRVLPTTSRVYNNYIEVPRKYAGDWNILAPEDLDVQRLGDNEIKLTVNSITYSNNDAVYFLLHMDKVYIPSNVSEGDIFLVASGPSGTGFPRGEVAVARVSSGKVKLSVIDSPTFSDDTRKAVDPVTIRIEEELRGSLEKADKSLRLVLPNGFEWQDVELSDFKLIWGGWGDIDDPRPPKIGTSKGDTTYKDGDVTKSNDLVIYADKDELIIKVINESVKAACFELTLGIDVANENKAKKGDVTVKIRGDSDVNVTEVTVGKYGEYGVEIKADRAIPTLFAGKLEQQIADIKIIEDVKGSLVDGRTITLRLPSNAKWGEIDTGDTDNGVRLQFTGFVGDDGREIKYRVDGKSTDAAELKLEKMEVVLEPGVSGDLEVEIGGTQGLRDTLVVAEVVNPIDVKALSVTDLKIGLKNQDAGDLVITEAEEGAISDDKDLIIKLPKGVKFETVPKVKVTRGDLDIDEDSIKRQQEDQELVIPIDGESTEASTIEITSIKYTVDRTVAEGDVKVKIQGPAVAEVNDRSEIESYFSDISDNDWVMIDGEKAFRIKDDRIWPQSEDVAEVVNARVITPAPGDIQGTAVFKVGEQKYTVNGQEVEMDVAPIAEMGRVFLPARFVANAMGVPDHNIIWDQSSETVTVFKDDRVVQMRLGSYQILVNGLPINMDVTPRVVPGRVLIPFRFLAQSLGAEVIWEEAEPDTVIIHF